MYAVMRDCHSGTTRTVNSASGIYWEDVYHVITWCVEATLSEAVATANQLCPTPTKWVRRAFVQPWR